MLHWELRKVPGGVQKALTRKQKFMCKYIGKPCDQRFSLTRVNVRNRIAICILEYYYLLGRDFNGSLLFGLEILMLTTRILLLIIETLLFHQKREPAMCTISNYFVSTTRSFLRCAAKEITIMTICCEVSTSSASDKVKFLSSRWFFPFQRLAHSCIFQLRAKRLAELDSAVRYFT